MEVVVREHKRPLHPPSRTGTEQQGTANPIGGEEPGPAATHRLLDDRRAEKTHGGRGPILAALVGISVLR